MVGIRKGTLADLKKYYTMMEIDFNKAELINSLILQKGMIDGNVEMFVFYDESSKIDVGYTVTLAKNVYSYVLIKYFAIFPWYRYKGYGKKAYALIEEQYKDKYGLIVEIPVFEDNDEEQISRLIGFFTDAGYTKVKTDYHIGNAKVNVMCKGIRGTNQISRVAHRIITDFYTRLSPKQKPDINSVS